MPRYSQSADAARAAAEQAEFNEKKWVWVPDEESGYLAGWVIEEDDDVAEVMMAAGGEVSTNSEALSGTAHLTIGLHARLATYL
jgi:uncharacterized iron-regulated membrane protein